MTHTYEIAGMTCNGCAAKVKSELLKLSDVLSAEVQLESPQAVINMQKHIPINKLQEAVNKAGKYIIKEANAEMPHASATETSDTANSYYPIFLIFGYITGVTLIGQLVSGHFNVMLWMQQFMAGFFLVFSFFKLLDLKGFAEGYSSYDIIARKMKGYGYIYPFIELGLGIALLCGFVPLLTNIIIMIIMGISTIGVAESILKKSPFECACLGTIIKLPLSKVTLFEDILMVVMSLGTILFLS